MNTDVLSNIEQLLTSYEHGSTSATELERCVESHLTALTGFSTAHLARWRELSYRLVVLDLKSDGIARHDVSVVAHLAAIRTWLETLPR
jgi:hypothetical protein